MKESFVLLGMVIILSACSSDFKPNKSNFKKGSQLELLRSIDVGSVPSIMFNKNIDTVYAILDKGWYNAHEIGDTIKSFYRVSIDTIESIDAKGWGYFESYANSKYGPQTILSGSCVRIEKEDNYKNNRQNEIIHLNYKDTIGIFRVEKDKLRLYESEIFTTYYRYQDEELARTKTIYHISNGSSYDSSITNYYYLNDTICQIEITHYKDNSQSKTFKKYESNKLVKEETKIDTSQLYILTYHYK